MYQIFRVPPKLLVTESPIVYCMWVSDVEFGFQVNIFKFYVRIKCCWICFTRLKQPSLGKVNWLKSITDFDDIRVIQEYKATRECRFVRKHERDASETWTFSKWKFESCYWKSSFDFLKSSDISFWHPLAPKEIDSNLDHFVLLTPSQWRTTIVKISWRIQKLKKKCLGIPHFCKLNES